MISREYQKLQRHYQIISVSPTVISNDQIVTVTFNTSAPSFDDWIGAYSPPPSSIPGSANYIFDTVPVKYGRCVWSGTHEVTQTHGDYLVTGIGSLAFNLTNLRADVVFYYMTGGKIKPKPPDFTNTKIQALSSQRVSFKNINEPLRNRIVPTTDVNIYSLLWSAANTSRPTIRWGLQSTKYIFTQAASVVTVPRSLMCGPPASTVGWRDLGSIYSAAIVGIEELSLYNRYMYYIFGDKTENNWSGEYKFWVPPKVGTKSVDRGTRLLLTADFGVGASGPSLQTST
jgi:hypothetical protein